MSGKVRSKTRKFDSVIDIAQEQISRGLIRGPAGLRVGIGDRNFGNKMKAKQLKCLEEVV
jgi:hypothetical protein